MSDGRGAGPSRFVERIDRLRRTNVALGGTPIGSAPDTVAALTACIRTQDRTTARQLAVDWLLAAEQAVTARTPAGRDRAALALLARVLGVPADYFTDADTSRSVDEYLALAADASRRGVTSYGPCRGVLPGARAGAVHARVVRELERDTGRSAD